MTTKPTPTPAATIPVTHPNGTTTEAPNRADALTEHLRTRGNIGTEWVFMTAAQNLLRASPSVTAVEGWVTGEKGVALLVRATRRPAATVAAYEVVGAARIVSPARPIKEQTP